MCGDYMKKKLIFIFALLFIMFIPIVSVSAKEMCAITSGNGRDVGSEIKCGTEEFYVLENKDNKIKMLSKHNLNVGDKISYIAITTNNPEYDSYEITGADTYCMDLARSNNYNPYYVYPVLTEQPDNYRLDGCRVYELMNEEHIRQDARAIGTFLVNGKSVLPLYGITYMNPDWGYDSIVNGTIYENEYDNNGNLVLEGSSFKDYIDGYKAELQSQGFAIENVSFPTLDGIIDILQRISGKTVEVQLEYDDFSHSTDEELINSHIGKMDITKYIPDNYKWLYDATYWLGSGFKNNDGGMEYNDYYISNEGLLCALGRGDCAYLPYPIGNGVRPVVTISNGDLLYLIRTITDGNGSIEVVKNAHGGDSISFRVTAKKGLKLVGLTVTSDAGESIEFKEEDLSQDSTGLYSISVNKFTMPYDNVTIKAIWANEPNPETGVNNYLIIILVVLLISGIIYKFVSMKKDYIYK